MARREEGEYSTYSTDEQRRQRAKDQARCEQNGAVEALGGLVFPACDPDEHVDFFQTVTPAPSFPGTTGDPAAYQNLFAYTPDPKCAPEILEIVRARVAARAVAGGGQ